MNIRCDQLLRNIWSRIEIKKGSSLKDYLNLLNNSMSDGTKSIKISLDVNKNAAYTHLEKDCLTRRIMIGGRLVKNISKMEETKTGGKL